MNFLNQVEIEALHRRHHDAGVEMISTTFAKDDPLARSQGIDPGAFADLIEQLFGEFLDSGLSFVARDTKREAIAALVLADRFADSGEGSNAIAAIIDAARQNYFFEHPRDEQPIAHIHFVASAAEYRRQGLVQQVIEASLRRARELGIERVIVEASGNRSRRLLHERIGFEPRVQIAYADFSWRNSRPFADIAEHGGLCLMDFSL